MEHDIISQTIPYFEYFLIAGGVAGGIIAGIKFIHRKGVTQGIDTLRGKAIQKDICALKKEYEEDRTHDQESHRLMHKKIDQNRDALMASDAKIDTSIQVVKTEIYWIKNEVEIQGKDIKEISTIVGYIKGKLDKKD